MSFSIGKYLLDNPVALAPMAGVTDLPFRRLCRSFGTGYVVGEMLASDPSLRQSRKSKLRGVHLDEPAPRAIQIVGWDPEMMANAARFNVDQGASIIDINMGCPAKKVCKRYAGSALLDQESQVAAVLEAVVSAVDVPVTLKIRTGVSVNNRNGTRIAKIAEHSGIQALAVHGRTRECKYKGLVEYDTIRQICNMVSIPVFANGDIDSCEKARAVLAYTGADGVMIGRGAHGAPWFPGRVARFLKTNLLTSDPIPADQLEIVLSHLDDIYRFYGATQGVRIARKHIKWYVEKLPHRMVMDSAVYRAESPNLQIKRVSEFYKQYCHFSEKKKSPCQQRKQQSLTISTEMKPPNQGAKIAPVYLQ